MGPLIAAPLLCVLATSPDDLRLDEALPLVTFEELCAMPEAWLGEDVETIVQFAETLPGDWSGYWGDIQPATHEALDVWSDSARLWVEEEHAARAGQVHLVRGDGPDLCGLPAYTRLRVVLHVDAYVAGRGWFVARDARPLSATLTEGSLVHAVRGLEQLESGVAPLAVSELERALFGNWPRHHRFVLEASLREARGRVVAATGTTSRD